MADEKKNTGYVSPWQDQIKEITNKIINREKFSYDLNGDALYKQYKDRYMSQGKQAMMDTMGQAAALTGGYGNSYAQSVGQQTYQGYLQGLNDQIPTLYQIALDKYTAEGNQVRDNLGVMMQQDDIGYGRYRDQIADDQWQKEFNEDLRRWNLQWAARNATASSGGGGSRRTAETPNPKPKDGGGGDLSITQQLANLETAGATAAERSQVVDEAVKDGTIKPHEAVGLKHIWAK